MHFTDFHASNHCSDTHLNIFRGPERCGGREEIINYSVALGNHPSIKIKSQQ